MKPLSIRRRAFAASRVLVPSAVLLALLAPTRLSSADKATLPSGETPTARTETRLRKLHLVRPDLIPYPIAFEVYC